uniref:(northern house mosquito) hypothetical protein n=1 Tax=Culex pipiens TaxID=7175 RepID=A0A8D8APV0_CULPI
MVLPLDLQLLLIYYLVWICRRQRVPRYAVGRPRRWLDDVQLEVFHHEKRHLYLFSVHQRQYTKRNMSYEALMSSSSEISLVRRFEAYLRVRHELESVDREIVVWTEATFRKRDLELQQMLELCEMPDWLETGLLGVRRYRVKGSVELVEDLLTSVDPLYKLAKKIAGLLIEKIPIGTRNTSKESFSWMVEHVFEKNSFKTNFLAEQSELSQDTLRFRNFLEAALHQQFKRKQIADFQLSRIEQLPYSSYVTVCLEDHHITSDSRKRGWHFKNSCTIADAQRFLSALVFYTNVPTAPTFEKVIHQRCGFSEGVCSELRSFLGRGNMLNEKQINAMFELDEFRKNKPCWRSDNLQFTLESLVALEAALSQFCESKSTRLMILEAGGSVRLTLERIARVAEELLPESDFIFIRDSKCNQLNRLLSILESFESVTDKIPVVIVPYTQNENVLSRLKNASNLCRAVLVVDHSQVVEAGEFDNHKDDYSFEDVSSDTKDSLFSKSIFLQGKEYSVTSLLSDKSLRTIPMEALINWNACQQIILGLKKLSKDQLDCFIERDLYSESGEVVQNHMNGITVISGEPGIGKSAFLEKMSQEIKHKQCVSIFLNCRTKSNLFSQKDDILELLMELLNIEKANHFQKFLLQTLVQEKRIHLFLDDFDEICESKSALEWIQNLGFHSVVISVRPNLEAFLNVNLNNFKMCYLKPFNKTDQLNFLQTRWKNSYESQLEDLIKNLQTLFEADFLKIPQNLKIIAILHEEENFTAKTGNVAKLVETFIDKKFSLTSDRFFNLDSRAHELALNALRGGFERDHAELAFALECDDLEVDQETVRKLYHFGLVRVGNGKVTFVDSTFREWYLVKFLLTHHVEQKYFNRLMRNGLSEFAGSRFVAFLDHQIASVDSGQDLLGQPKVVECLESIVLRPNHNLSEIKVKQFHDFFKLECREEQLIDFIYFSIINNKFNLFEAIYDSLPINSYNNIRFKFCTCDTDTNFLDLSSLTEDNIVILLKTLNNKHPKDLIKQIITNFATDEPDFVTTALKRGFKRVVEQLFSINQSLTCQEEVDLLQDYIEQRWREYLKLAIVNNRIEILELVLSCIAKKYHQRVIKAFWIDQLCLHALAEVCQGVDESALEIVQLVVQFAEDNLSDFDLSSMDNRLFHGSSFREIVDKITCEKLRGCFEKII